MIKFERLGENVGWIKEFLEKSEVAFCDLSIGAKYMWRDEYIIEYAVVKETLILKEDGPDYKDCFYYPMGDNVDDALKCIEDYCRKKLIPFQFCCVDNERANLLKERYHDVYVYHEREWDDYIYEAEKFCTYSGKKFGGQRNHYNKFRKTYPNYKFNVVNKSDIPRITDFLTEYGKRADLTEEAKDELSKVLDYLGQSFDLGQVGGYIEVEGKIIALSIGEVVKDTLIVHVEKAFVEYSGAYPTMAHEFAKAFVTDGVKFINREEDCGDEGLRISKTQYHPIEIKAKNSVIVNTLFDKIEKPFLLESERLTITDVLQQDRNDYYNLYTDQDLNVYWGYDYKEDLGDKKATPEYFLEFRKSMIDTKEEYSFAVKKDKKMIGELVLHNFGYYGDVEIGFRFFKQTQGNGYATESATKLIEYCFEKMGAKKVKSRCYKQNIRSKSLIERLGLIKIKEDTTHFYFEKTKK